NTLGDPHLPYELRAKIYELGQQTPTLSDRFIAKTLKVSRYAASKYRFQMPLPDAPPSLKDSPFIGKDPSSVAESHEVAGDTWTVSIPKTRISTLDELIAHCKIDLKEWEIERFICNKWEVGAA